MANGAELKPDYIFEVSWEVCNKVGGIHTVLITKTPLLQKEYGDQLILIGPDVWKESAPNPEFTEDKTLFKLWRQYLDNEGLKVKIGRWKIPGNPIAVLVDFTPYFVDKNEIFTDLWIKYKLDSLTGQWDYIEPALFGYAAGKVIECFYRCHINFTDKVVAQFHEWMTGVGILYLEDTIPQVASIFTTHATVLGRCIAGNGLPFYSHFDSYNAEQAAKDFNVVAKQSLEKLSASVSDCFTTVSELTARKCRKFLDKEPDVITINGFDPGRVPAGALFDEKRAAARKKIFQVCEALMCQQLDKDSLLVIKSGRYEFKNKGIDIFINSLAELSKNNSAKKTIIGMIFVPASQTGARKDLLDRMANPDFSKPMRNELLTHYLQGAETDPIVNLVKKGGLDNGPDKNIKIVFAPTYIDGNDGIFNLTYYDLLIGFDLGIFPSYYEPWGYTPMESIAFDIPSVTTDVSGFGLAINTMHKTPENGVYVVNRNDDNEQEVTTKIAGIISDFTTKTADEINKLRLAAHELSNEFSWEKEIVFYKQAYNLALEKTAKRENLFQYKPQAEPIMPVEEKEEVEPVWRNIVVHADLPKSLAALQKLSSNLWVAWNYDAQELFEYIDKGRWEQFEHNPILFLHALNYERIGALEKDTAFIKKLNAVEERFDKYMSVTPDGNKNKVAYFCMEYGLDSYIKIYSGGLGILAGDYLKEASDQAINIVGVGLLYRDGYFKQKFSVHGDQLADAETFENANLPIQLVNDENGNPLVLNLILPGRKAIVHVWKCNVGRAPLYLLDTNVAGNSPEDQNITSRLYNSDPETRLKQELLLGLCGIRLLKTLNIKPDVYHCNEGHAAFIAIERLHDLIQDDNLSYEEAFELVKASTLYTTHTSVPAANDVFSEELLRKYLSNKPVYFNIDWEVLMGLGRIDKTDDHEKFSMMYFAAKIAGEINAVSKIHEKVSRHLFNPLWKKFKPSELPVGYVTNGVHYPTWTAKQLQQLYNTTLGDSFSLQTISKNDIEKISNIPDATLWGIRKELKNKLLTSLKNRLAQNIPAYSTPPKIFQVINGLNENCLIIGFARRFATYKRPDLIFNDIERLKKIADNADRPVRFLFAGKAHPNDGGGIDLIKRLLDATVNTALEGKIIFLENYDIELAKMLVQGVDLWLNTPQRELEASGTSGMKAELNGVLNFSVLDGWWAEGYRADAGWALPLNTTYKDVNFQNQLDAETIYNTLEKEIIPMYFERDGQGLPAEWIKRIKSSISNVLSNFTTARMIKEYQDLYYNKLFERVHTMTSDGFSKTKELTLWKKKIMENWKEVDVISVDTLNSDIEKIGIGQNFTAKIVLELGALSVNDVTVEVVFMNKKDDDDLLFRKEFSVQEVKNNEATYVCDVPMNDAGAFTYSFRILPHHPLLYNKAEFGLVKWI